MSHFKYVFSFIVFFSHLGAQAAHENDTQLLKQRLVQLQLVVNECEDEFGKNLADAPEDLILRLRLELRALASLKQNDVQTNAVLKHIFKRLNQYAAYDSQ